MSLCLAALALIRGRGGRSRRRMLDAAVGTASPAAGTAAPTAGRHADRSVRAVAALAGVAAVVVVGGWTGVALGVVLAVAIDRGIRRLEPRAVRQQRAAVRASLPFAADLLAAVLMSGAPMARAVGHVADALGGALADRLRLVARRLTLGAPAVEAWTELADVPEARPLVRAAIRANDSGAALAGACARLAVELRASQDAAADAAARRAEVLVVLPLGCCFLPAFVLLGVVPVVLGVLDDALR
jgi:pilus assembly protein TadC